MMMKVIGVLCITLGLIQAQALIGGGFGGWRDADTNEDGVMEVASFVEKSLNDRSNSMYMNKVSNIVKVQRQLVNGINYKIEFEFSRTDCFKNSGKDLQDCSAGDNAQDCTADVYQTFEGKNTLNDFTCNSRRERRAGGQRKVDNPEIYRDTAIRALAMSNSAFDDDFKIVEATTQVVAGQKIRLTLQGSQLGEKTQCKLAVWSRPWAQPEEARFQVTQFNCDKLREKRAGGISKVDNPEIYRDTAIRALAMTNSLMDKDFKIVEVTKQVVSGQLIRMTIEGQSSVCKMAVWSRPWLSGDANFQVTKMDCNDKSDAMTKRADCAGCVSDEVSDPNTNSEYLSLYITAFGLAGTNMDIGNIKIKSVKTQVVSGLKYIMEVETSEAGEPRMCHVELVEQAWMTPQVKLLKFDCKPLN